MPYQRNPWTQALATAYGVPAGDISATTIGPTWSGDVTSKAVRGLILFFVLAFGILGMCNGLARWYDPKKGVPISELVEAYTGMVSRGLVAA